MAIGVDISSKMAIGSSGSVVGGSCGVPGIFGVFKGSNFGCFGDDGGAPGAVFGAASGKTKSALLQRSNLCIFECIFGRDIRL